MVERGSSHRGQIHMYIYMFYMIFKNSEIYSIVYTVYIYIYIYIYQLKFVGLVLYHQQTTKQKRSLQVYMALAG